MRRKVVGTSVMIFCFSLILAGCEIKFGSGDGSNGGNSDEDYFDCTDRCLARYNQCIANGNTKSACALDMRTCENQCPIDNI